MSENQMNDQVTGKMSEDFNKLKNSTAGKAVKKGASKAIKKAGQAVGKAVFALLKSLVMMLGPWLLVVLVIIMLAVLVTDSVYESRGVEQEYQMTDSQESNTVQVDENGDYKAVGLSYGNKLVKAFYTYFSERSYYVLVGDDKTLYQAGADNMPKDSNGNPIKDKYGREEYFYLNPNMLWTLDEFLNENKFRYPEQFIKPVHYDKDTFELKNLTDDNHDVVAESTKYDKKGKAVSGSKVKGVWDYGFAPILHYQTYTETREGRGQIVYTDVWDVDSQTVIKTEIPSSSRENHTKSISGYPKQVWMIDKVVSSAGTITNNIIQEEVNTGETYQEMIPFEQVVDAWEWRTGVRQMQDIYGLDLFYMEAEDGSRTKIVTTEPTRYKVWESYRYKYWYKKTITMFRYAEGEIFENVPRYAGDPDTSMITGNRYFRDYFENYIVYVPEDVMEGFDFKSRTNSSEDELMALLEADDVDSSGGVVTAVDMSSFQLGAGASSDSYKRSLQYLNLFKKYGEMYGVDPYLLVAKASQESSGNHEGTLPGGRSYNGAAVGIMQIEKPGSVITGASAYNFHTGREDTMTISSVDDVRNVENNIRAGTMLYASRLRQNNYNIPLTIQAYNYGSGAITKVLELYAGATGKSIEEIKNNPADTGWMAYRYEIYKNPKKYFSWNGSTYGDYQYLEHVLSYYASPETTAPYVKKPDGSVVVGSGDLTTGFASGLSMSGGGVGDNWLVSIWSKIKEGFSTLFPNKPHEYSTTMVKYDQRVLEHRVDEIITMMFVMEEKSYFSEHGEITDEVWKAKYKELFSNPLGAYWSEDQTGINPYEYFTAGYTSPLKLNPATIVTGYGNISVDGRTKFHQGIDINAPEGTPVYAVSDGIVYTVGSNDSNGKYIVIDHGNSVYTTYANLKSTSPKEGATVKTGDQIGVTGNTSSEKKYALHFELRKAGAYLDASWIVTGQGVQAVATGPLSIEGSEKAQQIYSIMSQYLGSWYAWGGTTPPKKINGVWESPVGTGSIVGGREVTRPGFDCSGLMYYAFKQVGITLPRVAHEQQSKAVKVNKEDIQAGDLIFFGNPAYHVGMYIGNGQYIHAPGTGRTVTIANVNWSRVSTIGRYLQ